MSDIAYLAADCQEQVAWLYQEALREFSESLDHERQVLRHAERSYTTAQLNAIEDFAEAVRPTVAKALFGIASVGAEQIISELMSDEQLEMADQLMATVFPMLEG